MNAVEGGSFDVEHVRQLVRDARALTESEHPMVAQAADRVRVILMELLVEINGEDVLGPWQEVG
jgi:hypothetical protein